jgi:hypothetical protein
MDKKTFAIIMMVLLAVALGVANFAAHPPMAQAAVVVTGRDYQSCTVKAPRGGDALYILDNKTGQLAVFTYDFNTRDVRARAVRFVRDAFSGR